ERKTTMRGSIKRRYANSWSLILDLGYQPDPRDPTRQRRKQQWITFRGSRQDAETKLNELLHEAGSGTLVEPSKLSLALWLPQWLAVSKRNFADSTYVRYKGIIEKGIQKSSLATLRLQKIRPSDIEAYYAGLSTLSEATLMLHHAILHRAFRKAVK